MSEQRNLVIVVASLTAAMVGFEKTTSAALVYQNNFDNSPSSTTLSTPVVGTGTLGIVAGGVSSFAATGGVSTITPGVFNDTATYGTNANSSVAGTNQTGGSAITSASGLSNKFTVSFWVKTSTLYNNTFPRLFILGPSGTVDNGAGAIAMELRGDATGNKVDFANGANTVLSLGNYLSSSLWNFVAITYDGTAANPNATLYEGTSAANATAAATFNLANIAGGATLNFGSSPVLLLGNRSGPAFNLTRGLNGSLDDFRIYDTALTSSDVIAAQQSAIPEPASLGLLTMGGLTLLRRRRGNGHCDPAAVTRLQTGLTPDGRASRIHTQYCSFIAFRE